MMKTKTGVHGISKTANSAGDDNTRCTESRSRMPVAVDTPCDARCGRARRERPHIEIRLETRTDARGNAGPHVIENAHHREWEKLRSILKFYSDRLKRRAALQHAAENAAAGAIHQLDSMPSEFGKLHRPWAKPYALCKDEIAGAERGNVVDGDRNTANRDDRTIAHDRNAEVREIDVAEIA